MTGLTSWHRGVGTWSPPQPRPSLASWRNWTKKERNYSPQFSCFSLPANVVLAKSKGLNHLCSPKFKKAKVISSRICSWKLSFHMPVCHLQSHLRAWQWGRLFSPSVLVIVISESESLLQWDWPWSQVVAEPAWLRWYHCRDGIRIPIADNLLSLNSWRNVQWNNSINSLGLCFLWR